MVGAGGGGGDGAPVGVMMPVGGGPVDGMSVGVVMSICGRSAGVVMSICGGSVGDLMSVGHRPVAAPAVGVSVGAGWDTVGWWEAVLHCTTPVWEDRVSIEFAYKKNLCIL